MSADYRTIPRWSEQATRCAVCLRQFPTTGQIAEHTDQDCDSPCWCEALCWVMEGGHCQPVDGQDLDVDELFVALRACQERIAALERQVVAVNDFARRRYSRTRRLRSTS